MAEWLLITEYYQLVLVISVVDFHDEDDGAVRSIYESYRFVRRAYTSIRMLWIRAIKSLKEMIDMKHMIHAMWATSEMDLVQLHLVDRLNPSWM